MKIHEIKYTDTFPLRNKILRPNLTVNECEFPGDTDDTTHHFACTVNTNSVNTNSASEQIVGIVSIYKKSNPEIHTGCGFQIRAMATDETFQGKGMGMQLLKAAEKKAFGLGANYVWANARSSAIGFYKKAGYLIDDKEFVIEDKLFLDEIISNNIESYKAPTNKLCAWTYFTKFDSVFQGLMFGSINIVGGRPGMGKTQFLIDLSHYY